MKLNLIKFLILPIIFIAGCSSDGTTTHTETSNTAGSVESYTRIVNDNASLCSNGNSFDIYRVIYQTTGVDGDTLQSASMAVIVPNYISGGSSSADTFLYLHGTITERSDAPSQASSNDLSPVYVPGGIACYGYVTVAPDYLGLGEDTTQIHPYHHAQSTALVSIDALRAAKTFLNNNSNISMDTDIYITGFSQGGYATMVTHQYIQEYYSSEFNVIASFPSSGAYDLSGTTLDLLFSNELYVDNDSFEGLYFAPYMVLGYQHVYSIYDDISDVFISSLSDIESYYDMDTPYYYINNALNSALSNSGLTENVIQHLFQDDYLSEIQNNSNHPFRTYLSVNDAYKWRPESPIYILTCDGDKIVPSQNAYVAYDYMTNTMGSTEVSLQLLSGSSHSNCVEPSIEAIENILSSTITLEIPD